jgi:hypothetical protein
VNGVATVGSWVLDSQSGPNTLTATITGGSITNNPLTFRAASCSGGGGTGFAITLCLTSAMTASQRAAFENAAARWGSIITGDVADLAATPIGAGICGSDQYATNMVLDDLIIFASIVSIDGAGGILGSAGPCLIRSGARGLPVVGTMRFDIADVTNLEASSRLGTVILHEMGHVLGIGTMWENFALLKNPSIAGSTAADTYFSGVNAIAAFNAAGGSTYTGGQRVPVENLYNVGTINGHWRESVLTNELMTGFLNVGANPLSAISIQSLADLGYQVTTAGADPFSMTLSLQARLALTEKIAFGDDSYKGPRYTIDARGRITKIFK